MLAYGHARPTRLEEEDALISFDAPEPVVGAHDLLVKVRAVSVNPVDWKVRANLPPEGGPRILGWDAAGEVLAAGAAVTAFAPGDRVFYAGDLQRPGSNAERQSVDARLVGRMPSTLDFSEAAALPLTAITAWEMLFDRLRVPEGGGEGQSLLIVGAAGGVGSIAIQLARALTGLTIIATASRPETRDWVTSLGAHHVVDHRGDLASAVTAVEPGGVDYIFSTNATEQHWPALVEVAAPQARLGIIDDPSSLDPTLLKMKSLSLSWEFMFTRSMHATPDMAEQGRLLTRLAGLVDDGRVRSTLADVPGTLSVDTLRNAHARLERGTARGKIVLTVN